MPTLANVARHAAVVGQGSQENAQLEILLTNTWLAASAISRKTGLCAYVTDH
jgi:hypothetical protein